MSKLKEAAMQSSERWAESLPEELPDVQFSSLHDEKMQRIIKNASRKNKSQYSVKMTVRVALVAAVLIIITLVSVSGGSSEHSYTITDNYGQLYYNVDDAYGGEIKENLQVDYIPEGYVLTEDQYTETACVKTFHREETLHNQNSVDLFHIQKQSSARSISLGHKNYIDKMYEVIQDDHTYVVVEYDEGNYTIIWNTGDYVYTLYYYSGGLTESDLIRITSSTK